MKRSWLWSFPFVAVVVFVLLGGIPALPTGMRVAHAGEASRFDWKAQQGKQIRVWIMKSAFSDTIEPKLAEFEKLTGIKVSFEAMSDLQYRPKLAVDLTAGSGAFDVFSSMTIQEGEKFARSGWYEPLDRYIKSPQLTPADWDLADYSSAAQGSMRVGEVTTVIPWEAQTMVLFYRKDLFQQAGLKPPTTFEEMEAAAKALTKMDGSQYGIALRGAGAQISSQFSGWLYSFGGEWLDKSGTPALDSEPAIKAFDAYGRMARLYGPPGGINMNWIQVGEYFAQGKAAMLLDINIQFPRVNDAKAPVHGKVGVMPMPRGPAGSKPFVAGWGLSINPKSQSKDAAWTFVQWATNKENMLALQLIGFPTPRNSAWTDARFKAKDPAPDLTQASLAGYRSGQPYMNPPIVAAAEARDYVGVVGTVAMQGGDVRAAAKKAVQQIKDLIAKTQ
jgi:multiple sugar transport system substrate-binding protein